MRTVRSSGRAVDLHRLERALDAVTVTPSTAVELYSLLSTTAPGLPTGGKRSRLLAADPDLARELARFWEDGGLESTSSSCWRRGLQRLGDEDPVALIDDAADHVGSRADARSRAWRRRRWPSAPSRCIGSGGWPTSRSCASAGGP